jgi:hypothetical protein
MSTEIRNAVIEYTQLGDDEHGGMTFIVGLDYGGSGQGFGTYGLGSDDAPPLVYMHLAVREILRVAGVRHWEQLVGMPCRAEIEGGWIRAIGHITRDRWFRPKEAFAPYEDAEYRVQQINALARESQAVLDQLVRWKGEEYAQDDYEIRRLRERLDKLKAVTP